MAWIRTVPDGEAAGLLKKIYEEALARAGRIWNIVRVSSLRPQATRASLDLYGTVMLGHSELTRGEREMLAVVVSRVNECHY